MYIFLSFRCFNRTFKKILLDTCKAEFQKGIAMSSAAGMNLNHRKTSQIDEDQQDLELKQKKIVMGNINFIGELFKVNLLSEK